MRGQRRTCNHCHGAIESQPAFHSGLWPKHIASDVDGIPEDVKHGESALLVKPGSVPDLAEALNNLLCNPDLRLRLANQGREVFAKRFWRGLCEALVIPSMLSELRLR